MNPRALAAEFIGSFALILAGCGTALASGPVSAAGTLAVALAFGLTFLAIAFAFGHVSGGHFNPAVTIGLIAGGRFEAGQAPAYIAAQVAGAIVAAAVLALLVAGAPAGPNVVKWNDMLTISNHFGGKGEFSVVAAFVVEFVATALFLSVFIGSTSKRAPAGLAPIAIGLTVVVLHLLAIPITNGSLNPARSTATAVLAGGRALGDLWLFWMAPILGATVGGLAGRWMQAE